MEAPVDPAFCQWRAAHFPAARRLRASSRALTVEGQSLAETIFSLRGGVADIAAAVPAVDAYVDLPLTIGVKNALWMREHLYPDGVAWFTLSHEREVAIVDGRFYSSPLEATLIAVGEHLALILQQVASDRIIEQCAQLLAPIASADSGRRLGARLGEMVPITLAEHFADAFGNALLAHARLPRAAAKG